MASQWTKTVPMEPGWYWHRALSGPVSHVVLLSGGKIHSVFWDCAREPDELGGEFAGPIPPPPEE